MTGDLTGSGSLAGVRDFTMLVPPGWARIRLDGRAPLRVKNLVAARLSAAPAAVRESLRTSLTREVTAAVTTATRHGGLDVFLSVDPVAGMPVPASAMVTHLVLEGDGDPLAALLESLSTGRHGVEVGSVDVVEVAGAPALRRSSTRRETVPPAGDLPGGVLNATQLEYFVPVPGGGGVLVLTFGTPIEQLGPPLVELFDVMASSFRWVTA
jgi:hypothetical protein